MRRGFAVGLALAGFALSSCAETDASDSPPSSGGPSTGATSSSAASKLPRVADPIEMTQYKQEPCSVLNESQLEQLSLPVKPRAQVDAPGGPTCYWNATDETGLSLSGRPLTAGSSLAGSYEKYRTGGFENFMPITVAGYPGYLHRRDGVQDLCAAAVAVRNDLLYGMAVTVTDESKYYGKPCVYVKKAIKMATVTMSGSGS